MRRKFLRFPYALQEKRRLPQSRRDFNRCHDSRVRSDRIAVGHAIEFSRHLSPIEHATAEFKRGANTQGASGPFCQFLRLIARTGRVLSRMSLQAPFVLGEAEAIFWTHEFISNERIPNDESTEVWQMSSEINHEVVLISWITQGRGQNKQSCYTCTCNTNS